MERYGNHSAPGDDDLGMDTEELVNYLRDVDYEKFSLMGGVLAQTEAIGDPALPTNEQTAILNWLEAATREWERRFALEEPLAAQLRRLKPLMAAMAVTEADFLTPGAHPLHQLLDTIQLHAIGWQPQSGRLGQALEEQVRDVVHAALAWFENPTMALAPVGANMTAVAAKANTRASKLAQRLIETEQGRMRVAESKEQAAAMINAALAEHQAPADMGNFLKGPWYESAQLLLLKFGTDSAEWKEMTRTTIELLDSLQNKASASQDKESQRQHLLMVVPKLSKDIKRWLLSLQHDGEAVNDAARQIEFFHTKLLRKQALELHKIAPILLPARPASDPISSETLNQLQVGQWFVLDTDNSQSLRARLVLRMDDEQQLLFSNQAGVKVLQESFTEFARLMAGGKVKPLDTGASFSRCLASSAGVETRDDLDELTGVAAEKARRREEKNLRVEQERARMDLKKAERERAEQERQKRKQEGIEQLQREQARSERLKQEHEAARQLRQEEAEQDRQQLDREQADARQLQVKWEDAARKYREQTETEPEQARQGHRSGNKYRPQGADLNLPRDSWMGFRDSAPEILARLAVYNRQQDDYIFVDPYGVKVRQLSGKELLILIARGLAEILESKSRFRGEVAQAQRQAKDK